MSEAAFKGEKSGRSLPQPRHASKLKNRMCLAKKGISPVASVQSAARKRLSG
jgi:hypothetical protein